MSHFVISPFLCNGMIAAYLQSSGISSPFRFDWHSLCSQLTIVPSPASSNSTGMPSIPGDFTFARVFIALSISVFRMLGAYCVSWVVLLSSGYSSWFTPFVSLQDSLKVVSPYLTDFFLVRYFFTIVVFMFVVLFLHSFVMVLTVLYNSLDCPLLKLSSQFLHWLAIHCFFASRQFCLTWLHLCLCLFIFSCDGFVFLAFFASLFLHIGLVFHLSSTVVEFFSSFPELFLPPP